MTIFSIVILLFLWFFQICFLGSFYKWRKSVDLKKIANEIINNYDENNIDNTYDFLAYNRNICVDILVDNKRIYSSNGLGCMGTSSLEYERQKVQFIQSKKDKVNFIIFHPRFNNETLVYGMKLKNQTYMFISTSLQPVTATTEILAYQLIIVTFIVFALSFLIGYFISKKISKPIEKINESTKKMAKGDYDVIFDTDSSIREINELADTLNATSKELAKTEELRREFLANISHDLKTPLTMIKAYAELTKDFPNKSKEKRDNNMNVIIQEADRLNLLVNDILDLSKMQSDVEDIKYESFDITALIETVLDGFNILSENKGYEFIFNFNKRINVSADKSKIHQVIYNLVNNAINYTGDDKKVIIKVIDKNDVVRIEIKDTGNGIKPEDINYIWDKYYKVDKKHKRNTVGTGIGLSIVKSILEKHKTNYGVTTTKHGTTFYFELEKANQKFD